MRNRCMRAALFALLIVGTSVLAKERFFTPNFRSDWLLPPDFPLLKMLRANASRLDRLGTTLMFSGYFPALGAVVLSPSFSPLTTDGRVNDDPSPPPAFDIRFHQREIGMDVLHRPAIYTNYRSASVRRWRGGRPLKTMHGLRLTVFT